MGAVFLDRSEVAAVVDLKGALDALLRAVGDRGDDEFTQHPLWRNVTKAACAARAQLSAAS